MSYLTIDSSTSSTTVLVFNEKLEAIKRFQKEHRQIITEEGYIEHDLEEIYQNLLDLIKDASEIMPNPKFISLTNQRETFTLFSKKDGKPIHNAVVWQCTRGQKICEDILKDKLKSDEILSKTGLKPNTFFSGSKFKWLYNNKSEIKSKIDNGDILFGTIETYLIYRLTNFSSYVTDTTNASRTLLFNCLNINGGLSIKDITTKKVSNINIKIRVVIRRAFGYLKLILFSILKQTKILSFFNIIYSYYLNLYLNLNTYYFSLIISLLISILFFKLKTSEKKQSIFDKICLYLVLSLRTVMASNISLS